MPAQKILTMSQVPKLLMDGQAEIVTHDAIIQPGTHSFADQDALNAYLIKTFGAKTHGGGIAGSLSCKGKYIRRSVDGTPAVTFGNPVLDTISSANGTLAIGGRTFDLTPLRPSENTPGGASGAGGREVAFAVPALKFKGIVHDAEKWALDDGSYVEYRIRNGRLGFQAWRNGPSISDFGFWDMGVGISVWNTVANYEAASINAINYMSVDAPCQQFSAGGSGYTVDYNGTHVDLSDYGFSAQQPERVAGVCMAQWHHRQFADLVTAGSGCLGYATAFGTTTFPPDWTPIVTVTDLNGNWTDGSPRNAVISVSRRSFSIDMSAFGRPTASGTINDYADITAIFPDDKTYKGQLVGNTIRWSNGSQWTKVVNTVFDLNGSWSDGSPWIAVISEGPVALTVDMSDFDRPSAHGKIIDSSTITVTFPDDHAYTGNLIVPRTIKWSNGSAWTKKGV
jgi:hypothetical protein